MSKYVKRLTPLIGGRYEGREPLRSFDILAPYKLAYYYYYNEINVSLYCLQQTTLYIKYLLRVGDGSKVDDSNGRRSGRP